MISKSIDFKNKNFINLVNPLLVYSFIWLFSLFLYSTDFTNNIIGLNGLTVVLVLTSVMSFVFIYLFFYLITYSKQDHVHQLKVSTNKYILPSKIKAFKKIINSIALFWILLTIGEIILFKGIPIISVVILGNYDLDYTKFGLPSLHGLLNSCYFTVCVGYYLHFKLSGDTKSLRKFRILLFWPILVMSRAMLLWVLLEFLCVYLIFTKIAIKKILTLIIGITAFVVLFGYIGDSRTEKTEVRFTDNFIKEKHKDMAEILPTGFVWVYLYATTPINNLVFNIEHLEPNYDFRYSLSGLIPSVIRENIFTKIEEKPLQLYEDAFNVSSYFANYLSDFGVFGTLVFVSFLQVIITLIYFSSKKIIIGSIIAYSAIFYAIFTSVFFDNFISLVTIFQVMLGFFINYILYSKQTNNYVKK